MKILIIDDEPDIRRIAALALGRLGGHDLVETDNGYEGVRLAGEMAPDVILLDVMMPVVDGPTTFKALRADVRTAHIPVILLTAKAIGSQLQRLRELGAIAVLTKPFDPLQLEADVRSALAGGGA